jgi:alpha-ribazole phosphatase
MTDLAPGPELGADARRLAQSRPPAARIVTSPLARAARLADALGALRGLAVTTDARLVEMDFGRWEGRRWDDIPRSDLDDWAADLLHARPHGGESVAMLAERVTLALADYADALVVTHMGVIRAALSAHGHATPWEAKLAFGQSLTL